MLTNEERDVVVAAMRKYPAGVSGESWGSSDAFFYYNDPNNNDPKEWNEVEQLADAILLEGG